MILITDIGKDIDDAVALVYAIISGKPISHIVVTSKDTVESANICHNIIGHMLESFPKAQRIKIVLGSSRPLKDGIIHGNFYHGPFSKGHNTYEIMEPSNMPSENVVVISPMTDLSKLVDYGKATKIMFMGQTIINDNRLEPDMKAYNFKCDPTASSAVFQYQDSVKFVFVTKTMAYKVPFKKQDFDEIAESGHPVGTFLREHALASFEAFKFNAPDLYNRIYKNTDNISYCYDPLCMLALDFPGLFKFRNFNGHLLGEDLESDRLKSVLISTLKKGLCS